MEKKQAATKKCADLERKIHEGLKQLRLDLESDRSNKHPSSAKKIDIHQRILSGIAEIKELEQCRGNWHRRNNMLLMETNKKSSSTSTSIPTPLPSENKVEFSETKQDIWDIVDEITTETLGATKSDSQIIQSECVAYCTLCGPEGKLIEVHNTITCSKCGVVNEEFFDSGPERWQYNNDDSRSNDVGRCGCPTNPFFPKSSQGTIIVGPVVVY